jgi:hypothetical protein
MLTVRLESILGDFVHLCKAQPDKQS